MLGECISFSNVKSIKLSMHASSVRKYEDFSTILFENISAVFGKAMAQNFLSAFLETWRGSMDKRKTFGHYTV